LAIQTLHAITTVQRRTWNFVAGFQRRYLPTKFPYCTVSRTEAFSSRRLHNGTPEAQRMLQHVPHYDYSFSMIVNFEQRFYGVILNWTVTLQ